MIKLYFTESEQNTTTVLENVNDFLKDKILDSAFIITVSCLLVTLIVVIILIIFLLQKLRKKHEGYNQTANQVTFI